MDHWVRAELVLLTQAPTANVWVGRRWMLHMLYFHQGSANNTSSLAKYPDLEPVNKRWAGFCSCHPHKRHRRLWIGAIFIGGIGPLCLALPLFSSGGHRVFFFFLSFLSQCKHWYAAKLSAPHGGCYWLDSLFGGHTSLLTLRKVAGALNKAAFFPCFFSPPHDCWQKRESEVGTMYSFLKMWSHNFLSLLSSLCHLCNQINLSNFRPINVNGLYREERGGVWQQDLSGSTCACEPAALIIVTSVASTSPCRRSSGPKNFTYCCAWKRRPDSGVENKNHSACCVVEWVCWDKSEMRRNGQEHVERKTSDREFWVLDLVSDWVLD